ncbi:hypothetical protein Tco_1234068 [Tanacetum coccineum]
MNRTTYPDFQELPSLFLESCFNGNRHVYVTSNRRYRFKAKLVGDDTFYVTGYDNDGLECGGYNVVRKRSGRLVTRVWPYQDYPQMLPTDFLTTLDQNAPLSISAIRINHDVRVQRVEIGDKNGVFKYLYRVDGGDFYEICDDLRFIVINNPFWKVNGKVFNFGVNFTFEFYECLSDPDTKRKARDSLGSHGRS